MLFSPLKLLFIYRHRHHRTDLNISTQRMTPSTGKAMCSFKSHQRGFYGLERNADSRAAPSGKMLIVTEPFWTLNKLKREKQRELGEP